MDAMQKLKTPENLQRTLERLRAKRVEMVRAKRPPAEIASVGFRIEKIELMLRDAEKRNEEKAHRPS